MKSLDYYYPVTRIHYREKDMLSDGDIKNMLAMANTEEVFNFLVGKGWGDEKSSHLDTNKLLETELNKTWNFVSSLVDTKNDPIFNIFPLLNDYSNLKAAVKIVFAKLEDDTQRYFMPTGNIKAEILVSAVRNSNYSSLPDYLQKVAENAFIEINKTGSGQSSDIIIDVACLEHIYKQGLETKNDLIIFYVNRVVDLANIKTAIRGNKMSKLEGFYDISLVDHGTLDKQLLKSTALSDIYDIYEYLSHTDYREAVDSLALSVATFETWCDNSLIKQLKPQIKAINGLEPIIAYVLAKEIEIKTVKIVFAAKANDLDEKKIEQRVRMMYV